MSLDASSAIQVPFYSLLNAQIPFKSSLRSLGSMLEAVSQPIIEEDIISDNDEGGDGGDNGDTGVSMSGAPLSPSTNVDVSLWSRSSLDEEHEQIIRRLRGSIFVGTVDSALPPFFCRLFLFLLPPVLCGTKSLALSRRLCLIITPVKPQLQPTFYRHHKGVAGAGRPPSLLA
jgi:hypothetical protein